MAYLTINQKQQVLSKEGASIFTIERRVIDHDYQSTLGVIFDENGCRVCDTCENTDKRIDSGLYKLIFTYSPRFKRFLPLFSHYYSPNTGKWYDISKRGLRIHSANFGSELRGCVALGDMSINLHQIENSRATTNNFIDKVCTKGTNEFYIRILGNANGKKNEC